MSDTNGAIVGGLAGWVIVQCHGLTLLGQLERGPDFAGAPGTIHGLSPVYELIVQQGPQPDGRYIIARFVGTVRTMLSCKRLDLPAGCLVMRVDDLAKSERNALAELVRTCDDTVRRLRAAELGIHVPGGR